MDFLLQRRKIYLNPCPELVDHYNINTANAEQLQVLDGVGPATASAIIEYRESNRGFASVAELTSVKGIGDKTLQNLSDDVTVSTE